MLSKILERKAYSAAKFALTKIDTSVSTPWRVIDGIIYFKFNNPKHQVTVSNLSDYRKLLIFSFDILYIFSDGIKKRDLEKYKKHDSGIIDWYKKSFDYQFKHEKRHFLGSKTIPTLQARLGVSFYLNRQNKLNSYPFVDFQGYANLEIFKEVVVKAPEELSKRDYKYLSYK